MGGAHTNVTIWGVIIFGVVVCKILLEIFAVCVDDDHIQK